VVADAVTELVVDLLEVVEVEEDQGELLRIFRMPPAYRLQLAQQRSPVQ